MSFTHVSAEFILHMSVQNVSYIHMPVLNVSYKHLSVRTILIMQGHFQGQRSISRSSKRQLLYYYNYYTIRSFLYKPQLGLIMVSV